MIAEIKTYLEQNGVTDTIYLGFLPATPDTAIALFETAGMPPDPKSQYSTLGIQVHVRAKQYNTARTLIYSIYNKLQSFATSYTTQTMSGTHIVQILAVQNPYAIGRDDIDRPQFTQNYIIEYEENLLFRR